MNRATAVTPPPLTREGTTIPIFFIFSAVKIRRPIPKKFSQSGVIKLAMNLNISP